MEKPSNDRKSVDLFSLIISFSLGLMVVSSLDISGVLPISLILCGFYVIIYNLRNKKETTLKVGKVSEIEKISTSNKIVYVLFFAILLIIFFIFYSLIRISIGIEAPSLLWWLSDILFVVMGILFGKRFLKKINKDNNKEFDRVNIKDEEKIDTAKENILDFRKKYLSIIAVTAILIFMSWQYFNNLKERELTCLRWVEYSGDYYYIESNPFDGNEVKFKTHDEGMNYCLKTLSYRNRSLTLKEILNQE